MADDLAAMLKRGMSYRAIGEVLGVHKSTIMRRARIQGLVRGGRHRPRGYAIPAEEKLGMTTEQLAAEVQRGLAEHKGTSEIADDMGLSRKQVYRIASDANLALKTVRRVTGHATIRDYVQDMKPLAALEYVLEAYAQVSGEDRHRIMELVEKGLSSQQARIYQVLERHKGMPVAYERLITVVSHAQDKPTSDESIKIQVHNIRNKIASWPTKIVTIWGMGYMLEDKEPVNE